MAEFISVWEIEVNARKFLESERGAVSGTDLQFAVIGKIAQLWCENPARILDLGCGDGVLGRYLLTCFPEARAAFVDISDPMLDAARERIRDTPETTTYLSLHTPFHVLC